MRRERGIESDDEFAYRRPSVSAWVAAAAVAFAFFVLGGFIKTYQQLETLQTESRREIRELKAMVESFRVANAFPSAASSGTSRNTAQRRAALPALPVARQSQFGDAPTVDHPRSYLPEIDAENSRVTYSFGRSSRREGGYGKEIEPAPDDTGPCVVVAVNNTQKRIMVEGGRNKGFEPGTRLELSRQGRWMGDLRVVDVFDNMSACDVLHATLTPEPGDIVRIP